MPKKKDEKQTNFDTSENLKESHALMQNPLSSQPVVYYSGSKTSSQQQSSSSSSEEESSENEQGSQNEKEQGSGEEENKTQEKKEKQLSGSGKKPKAKIKWKKVKSKIEKGKDVSELLLLIFEKAPNVLQNDNTLNALLKLFSGQGEFWYKAFKKPSNIKAVFQQGPKSFLLFLRIAYSIVPIKKLHDFGNTLGK